MTRSLSRLYWQHPSAALRGKPVWAFDFDSTLRIHRGRGYDEDYTARVLAKLSKHANIVVFSNRSCTTAKSTAPLAAYTRLVDSFSGRNDTIGVYASLGQSSEYRKATTHMWDAFVQTMKKMYGYDLVLSGSYFCGDAAGRPGDFAATDCAFARNIGIRFLVPEQVFGGVRWDEPTDADPDAGYSQEDLEILEGRAAPEPFCIGPIIDMFEESDAHDIQQCDGEDEPPPERMYFVLFMGAPASGKTTAARQAAKDSNGHYLDEVEMRKFPSSAKRWASIPGMLVADATHPSAARRKELFTWARGEGYTTILVHMETSRRLCEHLNMARAQITRQLVPIIAHRVYWKNLEPPKGDEADYAIRTRFHPDAGAPREVTQFRY